jgi:predicted small metal-binding protein
MKSFSCGDVVPGCDARFLGRTDEVVLGQVTDHAAQAHGLTAVPTHLMDAVRSHIADLATDRGDG